MEVQVHSVLQGVAGCCNVWCRSVLQCMSGKSESGSPGTQRVAVCCKVLQGVAMCGVVVCCGVWVARARVEVQVHSVLQCVAMHCSVLQ